VFRPDSLPGPVITHTYFIDENSTDNLLPVVSIATEPGYFWDPDTGLYTQDFKPEWEIPVNVELFENNGIDRAAFNQRAGIKVNGLYSWQLPQKMLGVYFRNAYGPGNLDYRLTPQRKRSSYKNFALRASGNDWSNTLFRDVLAHHSTLFNMDLDIIGFRPAVVYINGEYLGIHNIREKVDDDYIEKSYGMEPGTFDMVENQDYPEAGDLEAFENFITLVKKDLSSDANYQAVAELADIGSLTDMIITEMACGNTSIDHNVMAWKPRTGGKWRWILMDLDRGFFEAPDNLISFYISQPQLLLRELFRNAGYKEYFAERLASHLYTTFSPVRMKQLIDEHASAIEKEVPHHVDRWEGATSSYGDAIPSFEYWEGEVADLRTYVSERPWYLANNLRGYGFPGISGLILSATPGEAASVTINGLETATAFSYGPILKDRDIDLDTRAKAGYVFDGWYRVPAEQVIPRDAAWKYNDTGNDPGPGWYEQEFDDDLWSEGPGELGYGDKDESTVIGFGGNEINKYITAWFRKRFLVTGEQLEQGVFFISLKKDDGAVVYLNGTEIARSNIRYISDARTLADVEVSGQNEEPSILYPVDTDLLEDGENVLAVEVHQANKASSDLSFSLLLSCYRPDQAVLYSAVRTTRARLNDQDSYFEARYRSDGSCIVPPVITGELTLSADCSPYRVRENVHVPQGAILNIEAGVEILVPRSGCIFVDGILHAEGSGAEPVIFRKDPGSPGSHWGGLVFRNTPGASTLHHVIIEDASEGPDPLLEYAAISAFHADLVMDHLQIVQTGSNPIVTRFSDVVLTNSILHSEVTGDLVNVKYGNARIEGCRFYGNDRPDTDAIDLDETGSAVVRSCRITGFYGLNSDAVDLGEKAVNVLVDSVMVWNITDKGVSVGQWSSATVTNSVFVNCNMGVVVKDSSTAVVRNCLFYGTGYPVACFEKNPGLAGGNAVVTNSILSNSSDAPLLADGKSRIRITYSLTDNGELPENGSNLTGNPRFSRPSYFDFTLDASSPARLAGISQQVPVDMGFAAVNPDYEVRVMIAGFYVNGSELAHPQFIMLYNPTDTILDLGGYSIDKGVTGVLPEGTAVQPGCKLFLTDDPYHTLWEKTVSPVTGWSEGRLSRNGESIRLLDPHGIVADYLVYSDDTWPAEGFSGDRMFILSNPAKDNHLPEYWTTGKMEDQVVAEQPEVPASWEVYPNPTTGKVMIRVYGKSWPEIRLYTIQGYPLGIFRVSGEEVTEIDLSGYGIGIYLLRYGSMTRKIVVLE